MTVCHIHGIGVDIVALHRVRTVLARYSGRFPRRILHDEELEKYATIHDRAEFLARRFAAKEAVAKALGSGFTAAVYARNICICPDSRGAPQVRLEGSCAASFPAMQVLLSIADDSDYAVAYALALNGKKTANEDETRLPDH